MEWDIPSKVVGSWDGTLAQLTFFFIRQDQECPSYTVFLHE